jgi:hypothetical protein
MMTAPRVRRLCSLYLHFYLTHVPLENLVVYEHVPWLHLNIFQCCEPGPLD